MLTIADRDGRGGGIKVFSTKANLKPPTFTFINTPSLSILIYAVLYSVLANKSIDCKPLSIILHSYEVSHFCFVTIDPNVKKLLIPLNANLPTLIQNP